MNKPTRRSFLKSVSKTSVGVTVGLAALSTGRTARAAANDRLRLAVVGIRGRGGNYAVLASMMTPRPFMVERGHDDGVAPDEWVVSEYAKVRRHYDQLGLGDKTEIEFFNGPHAIHGDRTFLFLQKHLDWPGARSD